MKDKLSKVFYAGNIVLFVCAILCLVCYDIHGGLWLKGVTSLWFVILGFFNLTYARIVIKKIPRFVLWVELGLIFGMCADILLGVQFMMGILFFASGHVLYLVAFYTLEKFRWRDLLITLPIAVISVYIVSGTPYIQIEDPMLKKMLIGYAVIIACMLGKAISNLSLKKSASRWLVLLGSTMFWFSDVMLAIDMFGVSGRITWILCSYTYWPAQNILAVSLFYFINENLAGSEVNERWIR